MVGENYEITEMYPAFHAVAKEQGEKGAMLSIHYALEAEKIHEAMYGEAKALVENGEDRSAQPVYICPTCGFTVIGDPPAKCPVSQTPSGTVCQVLAGSTCTFQEAGSFLARIRCHNAN